MIERVLELSGIGKSFKTYANEWHRVFSWFGIKIDPVKEVPILKEIDFSMNAGESVGIIGQNGAGKSTLLKIITGTLQPSSGNRFVQGKVSAILELGMGFHPDLTGRQNTYHAAGLMGFTLARIDSVISWIEEFAEIGSYFDEPVRFYSSGMQMRVAFAVATAFRPEILIIDEALSVGDAYFQHKCFARIKEFQRAGTSLLFVSHDKGAVLTLCNRAVLLDKGVVVKDGKPEEVMDYYNALIAQKDAQGIQQITTADKKIKTVSGTKEAEVFDTRLLNMQKEEIQVVEVGQTVELKIKIKVNKTVPSLVLGYLIKDRLGQSMFGTNSHYLGGIITKPQKGVIIEYSFIFSINLGVGSYSLTTALHADETHVSANYFWQDYAKVFEVVNTAKKKFIGMSWMEPQMEYRYAT